jgi:dolichol-phosphate mannosyltransferase
MKSVILIPTYNERSNIAELIKRIRISDPDIDLMVIDDNSPDGTAKLVKELMIKDQKLHIIERRAKDGLGEAYKEALLFLKKINRYEKIITMDGDCSHDPMYITPMLTISDKYDLVIGSRYVHGGGVECWQWYRELLSRMGNWYSCLVLGLQIHDLTSGFVCFNKNVLTKIDISKLNATGYAYQIEFKYQCLLLGFSYSEYPIIFKERKTGSSKISISIIIGGIITPIRLLLSHLRRNLKHS